MTWRAEDSQRDDCIPIDSDVEITPFLTDDDVIALVGNVQDQDQNKIIESDNIALPTNV